MSVGVGDVPDTETVAQGVLAVGTRTVQGHAGVVVGDRRALAIDAGIDAGEGERVAAAVRATGRAADLLVYTHGHGDHVLGGGVFRGAVIVAHIDAARHIRDQIPAWAKEAGQSEDAFAAELGLPTLTFDGPVEIDLGDRTAQLIGSPGHAPGAVCVFIPQAGVLFGGDTIVTCIPPSFHDGDSRELESTLRRLAALDAEILVPGHGAVVRGVKKVREAVLWSADYLARTRELVAARVGIDDGETIATTAAPFDVVVGARLSSDRYRMVWRHEQTVRGILAELTASSHA